MPGASTTELTCVIDQFVDLLSGVLVTSVDLGRFPIDGIGLPLVGFGNSIIRHVHSYELGGVSGRVPATFGVQPSLQTGRIRRSVVVQTGVMPDVVVIGAGMAGAATTWALARRGRSVLLVDRFARGHDRGSSHGAERIFRFGYTDPAYVTLAQESLAGWHLLQARAGRTLLHASGVVDHGDEAELVAVEAACAAAAVRVEMLTAREATSRWPGMRFDGPVLHQPDGGRVDADRTLDACWDQAVDAGAEIRFEAPVGAIRRAGSGVDVTIGGDAMTARVAVVTAAGWSSGLLEPDVAAMLVPPITVTAETVAFFQPTAGPWPELHPAR